MTQWHYSKMGLQQGPVPEDELRRKIRRAEIGSTTLVWREGLADWTPLEQVDELRDHPAHPLPAATGGNTPEPPLPAPGAETGGKIPLPQPPAYQGNYIAPRIPNYLWQSIVALVVSGLMMLVMCLPIGMPFAIVAMVYATKVEGLRVQGNVVAAEGASRNARIWMIVSYSVSALPVLALLAVFVISLFAALQ